MLAECVFHNVHGLKESIMRHDATEVVVATRSKCRRLRNLRVVIQSLLKLAYAAISAGRTPDAAPHRVDGQTQDHRADLLGRDPAETVRVAHQPGKKTATVRNPPGISECDIGRADGVVVGVRVAVEPHQHPIACKARSRPDEVAIHARNLPLRLP